MERNDFCWCGSEKKWKKCHYPTQPGWDFSALKKEYYKKYQILLKSKEEIEKISQACQITARILDRLCKASTAGITTQALDELSMALHKEEGVVPAPLGYGHPPFPKSICTSLNEVICHGIPDLRPLQDGDIMNIDVSCIYEGFYGDCSRMVMIGKVSEEKKLVTQTAYDCLMAAIAICKPGVLLSEIGNTIESLAEKRHCTVVNQFVGHGVGIHFHEPPQVPHHRNSLKISLAPGMTFTIEPMINAGSREAVIDPIDQWTARTKDGKASAQWEHTILITETGHKILTPFPID